MQAFTHLRTPLLVQNLSLVYGNPRGWILASSRTSNSEVPAPPAEGILVRCEWNCKPEVALVGLPVCRRRFLPSWSVYLVMRASGASKYFAVGLLVDVCCWSDSTLGPVAWCHFRILLVILATKEGGKSHVAKALRGCPQSCCSLAKLIRTTFLSHLVEVNPLFSCIVRMPI